MQKAFVECEDALCGDVSPVAETLSTGYDQVWFSSAETASLDEILPKFEAALAAEAERGIDMEKMATVIKRHRRRYLARMEDDPAEQLLWPVLKHFTYAERSTGAAAELGVLKAATDALALLGALGEYDAAQWQALLRTAFVDAPKCHVVGVPSAAKAKADSEAETARVKAQAESFGAAKLQELGETVAAAVAKVRIS